MTIRPLAWSLLLLLPLAAGCPEKKVASGPAAGAGKDVATSPGQETGKTFAKGSVGTTAFCQLHADGWDELSAEDRIYAYYLARASQAGRDLFYDQMHREGLALRGLLEGIVVAPGETDAAALEAIRTYLRRMWVDGSIYDGHTSLKFTPGFTREQLRAAAAAAEEAGADFGRANAGRKAAEVVARLEPLVFDPAVDPILTARAPEGGLDIVQRSAVNFHDPEVTRKDVESLKARYALNSTVVKKGRKVSEEPWRAGDGAKIPPGRYARELRDAIGWLEKAHAVATPENKKVLEPLIRFYRTGAYADFHAHSVAWATSSPKIELVHGFIESYDDPLGQKGSFEGYVLVTAADLSRRMEALAAQAQHLEGQAPWKDEYKKEKIDPPVAKAYLLVAAHGDGGKTFPVGINLPNPQDIRETHGSKSLYLANIAECAEAVSTKTMLAEFALPEDREEIGRWGGRGAESHVALHEVAGHASGKVSPKLTADPSTYLKEYYATLEEARADLVAIWNLGDAKLIETGVVESARTRRAMYKHYLMNVLAQLRRAPEGEVLGQDHLRARQMIVSFAREKGAVETVKKDGKTFFRLASEEAFRKASGELLAELMRIKAEGDYAAAKALIEKHGVRFDPALRDEVVARAKAAGVPSAYGFMPPRMIPVKNEAGEIVDVRLDVTQSFDEMQLRYSGRLPE